MRGFAVFPFDVTWKATMYWGGRLWVGPGVPIPEGAVVGSGVTTGIVVGTGVGGALVVVGVAGGAGWVQPAMARKATARPTARAGIMFFMVDRWAPFLI
jgi:hypothetical protein